MRTALTEETWEAVNGAYIEVKELLARKLRERDLPNTLGRIRRHTALVRGTTHGTMLRNDIYDFVRIGTFLERADNTARILDLKYYVLLPTAFGVGSSIDNVQWETILSSNSARGGYRAAHGNSPRPREIAHFMILDRRMPRSLAFCVSKIRDNLAYIADDYGARQPSHDLVDDLHRSSAGQDIDVIFNEGLHEYLQDFLMRLGVLARQIEIDYRSPHEQARDPPRHHLPLRGRAGAWSATGAQMAQKRERPNRPFLGDLDHRRQGRTQL